MSNSTGAPAREWIVHHDGGGERGLSGSKAHHPGCGDHTAFLWVVQAVTISPTCPLVYWFTIKSSLTCNTVPLWLLWFKAFKEFG